MEVLDIEIRTSVLMRRQRARDRPTFPKLNIQIYKATSNERCVFFSSLFISSVDPLRTTPKLSRNVHGATRACRKHSVIAMASPLSLLVRSAQVTKSPAM